MSLKNPMRNGKLCKQEDFAADEEVDKRVVACSCLGLNGMGDSCPPPSGVHGVN